MYWIKDNKFLVALGGGTFIAMVLLYLFGAKGVSQYDLAKEEFDTAAQEAVGFENLALYPKRENLAGKSKALDEYRQSVESLQAAFGSYRPEDMKNISPQAFTNQLKATNDEVRKAFDDAGTVVPDAFFCGFEGYKTSLARGNATGILTYQLTGIKQLMLNLAAAGPTELKNVYRPSLPEREGKPYTPESNDVARPLALEITFKGPEKSVRSFLSSIAKPNGYYVVIRALRITNERKDPPRTTDAKFDTPSAAAAKVEPKAVDPFAGFMMPGDLSAEAAEIPAEETDSTAPVDSSRILSQVLGNEELNVFLRLDLMQFLPAKKLP